MSFVKKIFDKLKRMRLDARSYRLCLKIFDKQTAKQIPVLFGKNVKIDGLYKGCIQLNAPIKKHMVVIGTDTLRGVSASKETYLLFSKGSRLTFCGKAFIRKGFSARLSPNAEIVFGEDFFANDNLSIICVKKITFGADIIIGWNVTLRDTDGHAICSLTEPQEVINSAKEVVVGNHVWIAAYVDILKGAKIGNGCVVGFRSLVTKAFEVENAVIVGSPAKVVKDDVVWKH